MGRSQKPFVERHVQVPIWTTVARVPFADHARQYLLAARGH
jgi:hypothetical protein